MNHRYAGEPLKGHGTEARYRRHLREEGRPVDCKPCKAANTAATQFRKQTQKEKRNQNGNNRQ